MRENASKIKKSLGDWQEVTGRKFREEVDGGGKWYFDLTAFLSTTAHKENPKHPVPSLFNLCNYCIFLDIQ